jgi:hypothetical protein
MTDTAEQPGPAGLAPLAREDAGLLDRLRRRGLADQSLLYVAGSSAGLGLHALTEGAAAVSILAASRLTLEAGAAAAAAAGLRAEFVHGRLDHGALAGRSFDVAVCSLPDCLAANPLAWLHPLMARAGRQYIAVVDTPGRGLAGLLSRLPLALVPRPAKPGRRLRRGVLLTPAAVRNALRYGSGAFEPAELTPSPHPGRLIVEACRRTIGHLVVVAGPSSSGKSTLAGRLAADAQLRAGYGLSGEWRHVRGRQVVDLPR